MTRGERLTLEIPADPVFLATARLFAGAVARLVGMTPDQAENVELATSDVCSVFLRARGEQKHNRKLVVTITETDSGVDVEISPVGYSPKVDILQEDAGDWHDVATGLALVDAVTDEMSIDRVHGATTVRFSLGRP